MRRLYIDEDAMSDALVAALRAFGFGVETAGGSIGSLTTWLDANTVIWHESYAEKGGNGITISRADGGGRKLIPFFTVSDIRAVAPNLVSFSTLEDLPEGKGVQLT